MNPFRVDGKLAMVTGATRGIGLGAADALARSGASIMLVCRDEGKRDRSGRSSVRAH
jgi:NAD(P)-dependent dehydrogenase (short-subunit alcohol dehydrogenase family)